MKGKVTGIVTGTEGNQISIDDGGTFTLSKFSAVPEVGEEIEFDISKYFPGDGREAISYLQVRSKDGRKPRVSSEDPGKQQQIRRLSLVSTFANIFFTNHPVTDTENVEQFEKLILRMEKIING